MLGGFKARVAPCNVNYRYSTEEMRYLLRDVAPAAIVYHSAFAPVVAEALAALDRRPHLFQVDDASGNELLPDAVRYEDVLAQASPAPPPVVARPEDLYILYTGGTTGMPKGVLWEQGDALVECFGADRAARSMTELVAGATSRRRSLMAAPFMHGAGLWVSFSTWHTGGIVYVQSKPEHLDPSDIWGLVERHRIDFLLIVGDAFARPLLDELAARRYDASSLSVLLSGGAPLSPSVRRELLEAVPGVMIVDGLGSSESGGLLVNVTSGAGSAARSPAGRFPATVDTHVLDPLLERELDPGDPELGWLAKSGRRLALGYLGDPDKTRRTYPTIDGVRYVIPGDRARRLADGAIEVHGRDSVTINSGGEKIFAEEVEAAIKHHPAVYDCVVAGRPSTRWGNEVVAVVQLRPGQQAAPDELRSVAADHIARFKLPKSVVFVDEVRRSPSGKADYRWAKLIAETGRAT
jgi:fatty-acyl-CoA synthase